MKRWRILTVFIFLSVMLMQPAYADLPVIDWTQVVYTIKLLEQAKDQLLALGNIKEGLKAQLTFLQQDIAGNFGYGNLFNAPLDTNQRQWSNDSWTDVLNRVSDSKTSAFAQAQQAYAALYPVADANQIGKTQTNGGLKRAFYQQDSDISRAALAASSYSYDQINQHIQTIHSMLAMLENQPSEKAAIDLNTRLVAELSFIQLETLKQQTIQTQLKATDSQSQVNGMSDESKFMQWNP